MFREIVSRNNKRRYKTKIVRSTHWGSRGQRLLPVDERLLHGRHACLVEVCGQEVLDGVGVVHVLPQSVGQTVRNVEASRRILHVGWKRYHLGGRETNALYWAHYLVLAISIALDERSAEVRNWRVLEQRIKEVSMKCKNCIIGSDDLLYISLMEWHNILNQDEVLQACQHLRSHVMLNTTFCGQDCTVLHSRTIEMQWLTRLSKWYIACSISMEEGSIKKLPFDARDRLLSQACTK